MFKKIGDFFAEKVSKILPDTFVFAIILTIATFIFALGYSNLGFKEILGAWGKGFFDRDIIMFAFLLIMGLTFGYCFGISPPFKKLFGILAGLVKKPWQAYLSIVLFSMVLMLLHWGLAPVLALFTVELCKKVKGLDYRLASAATYSGMLVWHGGLSSSSAHMMATESTAQGFIDAGLIQGVIPVTETLHIPLNYALIAACFIILPTIILLLQPKKVDEKWDTALQWEKNEMSSLSPESTSRQVDEQKKSFADWLNNSPIISILFGALCFISGLGILILKEYNLAVLVLISLALALWFHWRPISFVNTVKDSIRGSADIVLQFPLFGAIKGLFITAGLAVAIAEGLTNIADAQTLPFFSFLTSSIVNIFIPSGGGEWIILGAPLLEAAKMVEASAGKVIIAFAYGDALTNLINPFWTLAFLPILGRLMDIRPRDFMGYAVFICIIFFIIESAIILLV